jgi:hypothetical protein
MVGKRANMPSGYHGLLPVPMSRQAGCAQGGMIPCANSTGARTREVPAVPRDLPYGLENANAIYTDSSLARFRGGNPFIHHG